MALTDEQREVNKLARRNRDAAFRDRRKAMLDLVEKAESGVENAFGARRETAIAAFNAACDRRQQYASACRAQIAALQEELHAWMDAPDEQFSIAKRERDSACDEWREARKAAVADAMRMFPDLQGHAQFSAAAWAASPMAQQFIAGFKP